MTNMRSEKRFPVLLIDDDPELTAIISRAAAVVFPEAVFTHRTSLQEAISALEEQPAFYYKLIFLDNHLNQPVSGLQAITPLNGWLLSVRIPIILMSAATPPTEIQQAYARGVNGFIEKPGSYSGWKHLFSTMRAYWYEMVRLPDHSGQSRFL